MLSLAPPPAPPRQDAARRSADDGKRKRREHAAVDEEGERQQPAASGFVVTAGGSSGVGPTAPLVEAVRAALAGGRGACALAAVRGGRSIKLRLTVDARGAIVRVELVAGDKAAEGCLQKALAGLSSVDVGARRRRDGNRRDHAGFALIAAVVIVDSTARAGASS